ncbi:MAG: alpha/beta fold hydrolase [Planctomycetes bacterium]|nr:alpha/beta fold hydrolase [Planctomycetota bacterium]
MSQVSQNDSADWRRIYPFASHWAELPGGRMHYLDEGPGGAGNPGRGEPLGVDLAEPSTLLFVHGNPTWSFHWRALVESLQPRYRCIAPDHLGCGLSDKPQQDFSLNDHIENLCTLVDKLALERVTLVAQDWGGAIGLGAMLRMPERLERIVLFNTGAFPPRYIPWRIRACRVPVIGRLAVQGANLFSLAALRMTLARRTRLDPAIAAGYLAPYDSWANRRAVYGFAKDIPSPRGRVSPRLESASAAADAATADTRETLAEIERKLPTFADRPICLIWGMRDWCFRPDCLERFVEFWPRAEMHRLPDVGHWVVEDTPEESLAIVEAFLKAIPEDEPRRHEGHEVRNLTSK